MGNISRRNFLKYAGLTGGVAGLASPAALLIGWGITGASSNPER